MLNTLSSSQTKPPFPKRNHQIEALREQVDELPLLREDLRQLAEEQREVQAAAEEVRRKVSVCSLM